MGCVMLEATLHEPHIVYFWMTTSVVGPSPLVSFGLLAGRSDCMHALFAVGR